MGKPTTYTGATETRAAKMSRIAQEIQQGKSTFGMAANSGKRMTNAEPAPVTNKTAREMVEADLALMKGLGM